MTEPDPKRAKQDWPADCLRKAAEQCLAESCKNVQVLVVDASRTEPVLLGDFTFNFESEDAEVFLGCLSAFGRLGHGYAHSFTARYGPGNYARDLNLCSHFKTLRDHVRQCEVRSVGLWRTGCRSNKVPPRFCRTRCKWSGSSRTVSPAVAYRPLPCRPPCSLRAMCSRVRLGSLTQMVQMLLRPATAQGAVAQGADRKSTRLNSSHRL